MGVKIPIGFGQYTCPMTLTGDLEEMVFTFGFTDDTSAFPADIATTIHNVVLSVPTFAASSIATVYTVQPGRVVVNRGLGTFEGVATTPARVGTANIGPLPQNCAVLVSKHSGRGGRRGRGRIYLPPFMVAESNVTAVGGILASVVSSISLDFNSIRAQLDALNLDQVLLHSDKVDPDTGEIIELAPPPDLITDWVCSSVVATQRNRLRR